MIYGSAAEICRMAEEEKKPFWEIVWEKDCLEQGISGEASLEKMRDMYRVMKEADRGYDGDRRSRSGLVGGLGAKFERYTQEGGGLLGGFTSRAVGKALKMAESNACMKRIVAAPTAGACGILPAVLLAYEETGRCGEDEIVRALYVAAGIGQILALRASIAGAEGGCQAEIGSGAAMTAGALAFLQGGGNDRICAAAAFAIKGLLGLVCDPIGGLVEVPCVKRNAMGTSVAITSAELAMAGIETVIPLDEVIDAMHEVGSQMHSKYKETSKGGLAMTPTAKKLFA